jgi:hypothetical protein
MRPFVTHLPGTAREHTGNVAFHHRTAVATGTGQLRLVRRAFAVQARGIEIVEDRLWRGVRVDRLDRLRDPERQNPSRMQRLAHHGVIGAQITRDRMDGQLARHLDPFDSGLDLVNEGHHIAGIARIPYGQMRGKDKAGGGLRDDPGLAPELGRTVAFALEDRCNGAIVGIDDFAVAQRLALDEPLRLAADGVIRLQCDGQLGCQPLAFWLTQMPRVLKSLLGALGDRHEGAATLQELLFRLAHQRHED